MKNKDAVGYLTALVIGYLMKLTWRVQAAVNVTQTEDLQHLECPPVLGGVRHVSPFRKFKMKKAFVFDFDDTLAKTDARVLVVMPDTKTCRGYVRELSPSEFNVYQLKTGERFDFSEFRCPHLVENGKPTELIRLAQDVYEEQHSVYILTARGNDVADAISKFLFVHKIKAKQIICLGDSDKNDSIADSKTTVLHTIMQSYDKIYFYDDNKTNVELAGELGIKTYLV